MMMMMIYDFLRSHYNSTILIDYHFSYSFHLINITKWSKQKKPILNTVFFNQKSVTKNKNRSIQIK